MLLADPRLLVGVGRIVTPLVVFRLTLEAHPRQSIFGGEERTSDPSVPLSVRSKEAAIGSFLELGFHRTDPVPDTAGILHLLADLFAEALVELQALHPRPVSEAPFEADHLMRDEARNPLSFASELTHPVEWHLADGAGGHIPAWNSWPSLLGSTIEEA